MAWLVAISAVQAIPSRCLRVFTTLVSLATLVAFLGTFVTLLALASTFGAFVVALLAAFVNGTASFRRLLLLLLGLQLGATLFSEVYADGLDGLHERVRSASYEVVLCKDSIQALLATVESP